MATIGNGTRMYDLAVTHNGSQLRLSNFRTPRGMIIDVAPGWRHDIAGQLLRPGMPITEVFNSGDIYLGADGAFYPFQIPGASGNYRGRVIGNAIGFVPDQYGISSRAFQSPRAIALPNWWGSSLGQFEHVGNSLVGRLSARRGYMTVIERRPEAEGMDIDSAKYIYSITPEGSHALCNELCHDFNWIRDVRITPRGVEIVYDRPGTGLTSFDMSPDMFLDNDGLPLLGNRTAGMVSAADFFQDDFYSQETAPYRPWIDEYNYGQLALILTKTRAYDIRIPRGVSLEMSDRIFFTTASAAARVGNTYVPLHINEPLQELDTLTPFSQTVAAETTSSSSPQNKLCDEGPIGGEYPRDDYFYGLQRFCMAELIMRFGSNFAMNRNKALRAGRGIQSGRNHTLSFEMMFDRLLADIMDTNSAFRKKLSDFGKYRWQAGVSEDTQMELVTWLLGYKMYVMSETTDVEAQETTWASFMKQNGFRYNFSESLFTPQIPFVLSDIYARFRMDRQIYMDWAEMSEIAAGATWYKVPFAKSAELSAIPAFLGSKGEILFFPVDYTYFCASWLYHTVASALNYKLQLNSLGMGLLSTGLWKNPAIEWSFLRGYFTNELSQYVYRQQFAGFVMTRGGGGNIDANDMWTVGSLTAAIGGATVFGFAKLSIGGWEQLLPLTRGFGLLANLGFGTFLTAQLLKSYSIMVRENRLIKNPVDVVTADQFRADHPQAYTNYETVAAQMGRTIGGTRIDEQGSSAAMQDSYEELFSRRTLIRQSLSDIGALGTSERIKIDSQNPYREFAYRIADLYYSIEMTIMLKAKHCLDQNPDDAEARAALAGILSETREYQVIQNGLGVARKYRIPIGQ